MARLFRRIFPCVAKNGAAKLLAEPINVHANTKKKPPKRNNFNKKLKNKTKKHTSKMNLKRGLKPFPFQPYPKSKNLNESQKRIEIQFSAEG